MAMTACHGCDVLKDPEALEPYPWPDDDTLADGPIPPFMELECQPTHNDDGWRKAIVCHACFRKLDPDMWINQRGWESIGPTTPFAALPALSPRT